ncbi:SDR family NAD(P)-dependent oxidoreductase [Chloroflexota bacterium]
MKDKSMQNQVAVVTGAVGGIGSAICRRLALAGASVVLGYKTKLEETQELANKLAGEDHLVLQAIVDDSDSCQSVADHVNQKYGTLDLLVNCAGMTTPVDHADLDGLTDAWIDRIFQVNWRGAFAMIRACKPLLEKDGGGTVINISSIAGFTGVGSNVAYCASKAALDSLTRSLGRALAPKIRVVSVSPGVVLGEYAKRLDPSFIQSHVDGTPLERLATSEDVAEAVWAVHTKLIMTTGNIIPVDGGRPLGT